MVVDTTLATRRVIVSVMSPWVVYVICGKGVIVCVARNAPDTVEV